MATVVAALAALAAMYIGLMQWRTAHHRLSFDLYEKRLRVYEAVKVFINHTVYQEQVAKDEIRTLLDGIRGAEFLFGGDTRQFVKDIGLLAVEAYLTRAQLEPTDKLHPEEEKLSKYLLEHHKAVEDIFRPYLDLSKAGLKSYWPW